MRTEEIRFSKIFLQGFFTTTFGLASGAVVAFMAMDRALSLSTPFFYSKHFSTARVRGICLVITVFCALVSALPFIGVGRYKFNRTSRSFCHFDWSSPGLADRAFVCSCGFMGVWIILVMIVSNVIVYVVVMRMKRKLVKVLPCDAARPEQRKAFVRQEEQMAKFVALVSCVFLFTWLPITVSVLRSRF